MQARLDGEKPPDEVRHVVSMLPGDDPMAGLRKGVNTAAVELGLDGTARASLRGRIDAGNLDELAYALNCDLPFEHVETLLIVDQAEEMLTQSSAEDREAFLKVLLHLTQSTTFNIRVALTVRVDFFNLFSAHDAFFRALTDRPDKTQLRLQKLSRDEIAEAVKEPLKLAGYRDDEDIAALTAAIQKDVSDRPGDTALIQFALWSAWRNRSAQGGLTEAYIRIGGVHGALAVRADEIRKDLSADDQQRLGALFARLVRPSGTGGATARAVWFEELDAETRALAATMADEDHARLLQTTGEDVRLAHEALIRQWPWLQTEIEQNGDQLRLLHRLMESAADWERAGRPDERLPQDAMLGDYEKLAKTRSAWLSLDEQAFVDSAANKRDAAEAGKVAEERAREQAQKRFKRLAMGSAFIAVLSVIAAITSLFYYNKATKHEELALEQTTIAQEQEAIAKQNEAEAKKQEAIAQSETAKGRQNQRLALAALADSEFKAGRMPEAMFLSLAAWPRVDDETADLTSLSVALKTLEEASAKNREINRLEGHEGWVHSVAFSPDGARLATASEDGTARIWDAATGAEVARLEGHMHAVLSVAFSSDGARLATAGEYEGPYGTARIWDAATGAEITRLENYEITILSVAFSPDGARLATGSVDGTARIWDVATGAETARIEGHDLPIASVAFSPDGTRLATGSVDGSARIWGVASGAEITRLEGHEGSVNSVVFYPFDGWLATASDDGTARIWQISNGAEIARFKGHESSVNSVVFAPFGRWLATASDDGTARIWNAATATEIASLEGHEDGVTSVVFSPDGVRLATASYDETARLWDATTRVETTRFEAREHAIRKIVLSPDGARLATASFDNTARIWDSTSGAEITRLQGHRGPVYSVAFSPDVERLATAGYDGTARIWGVASGAEFTRLEGHEGRVNSVVFSPHSAPHSAWLATAGADGTARIWEEETGAEIARFEGHADAVNSVAYSPDGGWLATASDDGTARIWGVASGAEITRLEGHEGSVDSVVFSPTGGWLATASGDGTARIWDAATEAEIARLEVHESGVNDVAFSPDGARLATASSDRTARIWDLATGAEIARFEGHDSTVFSVAFSYDGAQLVTGSADTTARIWDVDFGPGNFFALKCAELPTRTPPRILTQYNVDIGPPICSGAEPTPPLLPPKDKP